MYKLVVYTCLALLLITLPATAATAIARYVMGSGGGSAASISHSVIATIGQDVAGEAGGVALFIGSGFWHGGTPTTSVEGAEVPLPVSFALSRIAPNPFTPSTTIRFDVPSLAGTVKIEVFNIGGRRVKTVVNEEKAPGRHSVVWDGRTDLGNPIGAGVYFIVMNAPGYQKTQRLICIR